MKHPALRGMLFLVLVAALVGCTLVDPTGFSPALSITGGVAIVGSGESPSTAFSASASGFATTNYHYSWELESEGGALLQTGDQATFTPAARTVTEDETLTVRLTVTDGYTVASAETTYLVSSSTEPIGTISGGNARILVSNQVTNPYSISYANFDNPPTIAWSVLDDGDNPIVQSGTTDAMTFTPDAIATAGEYTVSVTLTDGSDVVTKTKELLVVEALPVSLSFSALGSSTYEASEAGTAIAPAINITGAAGFGQGLQTDSAFSLSASDELEFSLSVNTIPAGDAIDIHLTPSSGSALPSVDGLMIRIMTDQILAFTCSAANFTSVSQSTSPVGKTYTFTISNDGSGWSLNIDDGDSPVDLAFPSGVASSNFPGGAYMLFAGLNSGTVDMTLNSINGTPLDLDE